MYGFVYGKAALHSIALSTFSRARTHNRFAVSRHSATQAATHIATDSRRDQAIECPIECLQARRLEGISVIVLTEFVEVLFDY